MMRAMWILALTALLAAGPARASGLDEARSGADALAMEDFQVAILHYTGAIRSRDLPVEQLAVSYRQRGIAHFQMGRADFAILDFTSAMWLNGLDGDLMTRTYYNRGLAHEILGETDLAVADLTAAIGRNPSYAEAYNSRGHIHRKMGQYEQALADFAASHRHGNPEPHLPMYGMALTYEAMGKPAEARSWYSRTLMMKPDFEQALVKLNPVDIASGATPVPTIESEALIPPADPAADGADESNGEPAEAAAAPADDAVLKPSLEQVSTVDPIPASNGDEGSGGPLMEEGASEGSLPTLIDEPAPPEVVETAKQDDVLEPAAPPAAEAGVRVARDNAPDAQQMAAAPTSTALREQGAPAPSDKPAELAATSPTASTPAPTATANDYQVQLGSYASEAFAETEAKRLKRENPELLGKTNHQVQQASIGGKSYYRLRGTGLSREEAVRLCQSLRERDVTCVVARP